MAVNMQLIAAWKFAVLIDRERWYELFDLDINNRCIDRRSLALEFFSIYLCMMVFGSFEFMAGFISRQIHFWKFKEYKKSVSSPSLSTNQMKMVQWKWYSFGQLFIRVNIEKQEKFDLIHEKSTSG